MVEPPPDPKRQRLDEEEVDEGEQALAADADADGTGSLYPAELGVEDSVFEQYGAQQEFLDKVSEECSNRILAIEFEYAQKKRGALKERNKVLRTIPQFWKKVLCCHPQFRPYFTDADLAVLEYLVEVDYDDSEDPSRTGWKIRFVFEENPFFENTEVVKEYKYPDDSSPLVSTCTELRWKPGKAPLSEAQVQALGSKRPPPDNDYNFISNWLRGEPEGVYGGQDPLSETLKEEIWPNPMQVITSAEQEEQEEGAGFDDEGVIEIDDDDDEDAEVQEFEEEPGEFEEEEPLEGAEGYDDQGGTGEGDEFEDEGEEGDVDPADEGDNDDVEPGEGA